MQDYNALKSKSLAELREIGRSLGIRAQMRKNDLIQQIIELSAIKEQASETHIPEAEPQAEQRHRRPAQGQQLSMSMEGDQPEAIETGTDPEAGAGADDGSRRRRSRINRISAIQQGNGKHRIHRDEAQSVPSNHEQMYLRSELLEDTHTVPASQETDHSEALLPVETLTAAEPQSETAPMEMHSAGPEVPEVPVKQDRRKRSESQQEKHDSGRPITKDDFVGVVEGEGVLEIMPDGYGFMR
ncbi:MAG: Rho termination factor N-terminal domain-containing protein, partial [Rikenellaceae bacterium]|nr:Rho termination factor N-terminal domain-containing protein [Rikenellaceae bacterium]